MEKLADPSYPWPGQVGIVRDWYKPQLERIYDAGFSRTGDLEQLEHLSAQYPTRERFLTEMTLDPPSVTSDQSGAPRRTRITWCCPPFIPPRARNGTTSMC
jgi:DNA helicase-2/ATP-dependent DNA helicase PcrA